MSGGKFLKPWQVTDNSIEWIFFQFTFDPLLMTQTQEIITCKVSNKLMNGYGEMCMSGGKFHKEWQVRDKIIAGIFFQFTFHLFSNDSNSKNITRRASKIHECIQGNVYEWGKVS